MSFADGITSVNTGAYYTLGQSVTYTPGSGVADAFSCTAILGQEQIDVMNESGYQRKIRTCSIQHSELETAGLTEPTDNRTGNTADTITLSGPNGDEVWEIASFPAPVFGDGEWSMVLENGLRPTGRHA